MMRPMPVAESFLSQSKADALSKMKIYRLRMKTKFKSFGNIIQKLKKTEKWLMFQSFGKRLIFSCWDVLIFVFSSEY